MNTALLQAFGRQAQACAGLGSAFMADLMQILPTHLAQAPRLAALYDAWQGAVGPEGASLPLRLAGGLHALVRSGHVPALAACYPPHGGDGLARQVAIVLRDWDDWLCDWVRLPPQTNEVGRSAVLIAAARALTAKTGLPLRLSELGASAGLNLNFDHYRLHLGQAQSGPDRGVDLAPEWTGPLPPRADVRVVERRGVDLNPLNPAQDGARLMAYVWPDQPARMQRLAGALDIARAAPAVVDCGDAAPWLEQRLAQPMPGVCHMVFHTVAHQYFPAATQARIATAMQQAGALARPDSPLAWVGMEADGAEPGAGLTLTLWPDGQCMPLGRAGFHGQWVQWADAG
ncbi:DUF2332 domain-containing protein [Pseudotabrizicola sp. L79]|uniref:DUF2332 domain-containing protein n=1 Tax=Pseudotabrizicola sp. L79 TaxID=3118402 RepID=UPI002F9261B4